jgi:predicted oxidoreductase
MREIVIGGEIPASEIALGFWRLADMTVENAAKLVKTALDEGIDFFDHANVYGAGKSEELFAKAAGFTPSQREKVILQSKCGIRLEEGGYFDFSRDHIIVATEGILKRLNTDYLDILLLHRPDALMEPEEVADAFSRLHAAGKVRCFGVSNQRPNQMELLRKYCGHKIVANQLQFSVTNSGMIDSGLATNMEFAQSVNHDGDVLDYCRLRNITIQAWSPFQYGDFKGSFLGDRELYRELNDLIDKLARERGVTNSAIAAAWILRHPAKIQVIIGTSNPQRVKNVCAASDVTLSRPEWYALWKAAGNTLP